MGMGKSIVWAIALVGMLTAAYAQPTLDGSITAGDGYTFLAENIYSKPLTGGQSGTSDLVGETASYNYWDGINNISRGWNDNRADVINTYIGVDPNYLYIAVAGPTIPFNSFIDPGNGGNGDQGDLFIAIDASGGTPSGFLSAANGHPGFSGEGVRAVDFLGWTPTHIIGVQYVDNGGGGGGWATVYAVTNATVVAGEQQNQSNPFAWNAGINASAAYDTHNNNAGEFEFRIPWTMLGYPSMPAPMELRFTVYTTHNFGGSDIFDSGPGFGQISNFEEVGDFPGDLDQVGANLFLGAGDAGTIPSGSFPGANYVDPNVYNYSAVPNRLDEIDTLEGYYAVIVPEPGTIALVLTGALVAAWRLRRRA